jgi:hypothetical protein
MSLTSKFPEKPTVFHLFEITSTAQGLIAHDSFFEFARLTRDDLRKGLGPHLNDNIRAAYEYAEAVLEKFQEAAEPYRLSGTLSADHYFCCVTDILEGFIPPQLGDAPLRRDDQGAPAGIVDKVYEQALEARVSPFILKKITNLISPDVKRVRSVYGTHLDMRVK